MAPSAWAQSQPAIEAPAATQASSPLAAAESPVHPATVPAQQVLAETRPAGPRTLRDGGPVTLKEGPAGDLAWRLISSAVVVLVLGVVCFVVMRKVVPRINSRGGRNIRVIETAHLGPQKTVHLLKVGGQTFLVASTRDRVSLLAELPPTATFQDAVVQAGQNQTTKESG